MVLRRTCTARQCHARPRADYKEGTNPAELPGALTRWRATAAGHSVTGKTDRPETRYAGHRGGSTGAGTGAGAWGAAYGRAHARGRQNCGRAACRQRARVFLGGQVCAGRSAGLATRPAASRRRPLFAALGAAGAHSAGGQLGRVRRGDLGLAEHAAHARARLSQPPAALVAHALVVLSQLALGAELFEGGPAIGGPHGGVPALRLRRGRGGRQGPVLLVRARLPPRRPWAHPAPPAAQRMAVQVNILRQPLTLPGMLAWPHSLHLGCTPQPAHTPCACSCRQASMAGHAALHGAPWPARPRARAAAR